MPQAHTLSRSALQASAGGKTDRSELPAEASPPTCRAPLALAVCTLIALGPARASDTPWLDGLRAIHPYAGVALTSDSNVLRNPDGLGDESDEILSLEAGLDTELKLSRQRLLIDGRVVHNDYDRLDALDHTAGDARLVWKWAVGRLWEGDLGYRYEHRLRDLANDLIPAKDMLDRHRVFGSANRWLTTRWRLGGEIDWTRVSASETPSLDKAINGYGLRLDYISKADNRVGLRARYATTAFDSVSERDFYDLEVGPTLDWKLTGKTRIEATAGYKARTHDSLSERDFDGFVGGLAATWRITGKTSIKAALWRDISNLDDEVADYAIVDGVRVEPAWQVMPKTRIRALASYERRDFRGIGDGQLIAGLEDREDELRTLELGIEWRPRQRIAVNLSVGTQSRDSNRALREYDTNYARIGFSIGL
ncbi:outer membrane beta-barrel protein [Thiorhodococcus minor]|uniref:Outer membrane beta-barrel protein n=1 Tax=Thiorhodococcus minor TaxID=57489 RepID=A0A6M0JYF7_9GAMM|nr:outer membrane beta-barrel protein [Thiorhodococcus minor]NEV62209.1 outer membrane beta-barrel protein [Thiorhodococcus minor]